MKGSQILKEFKAFAVKGNMVDMAVGIIIGGAFSKVVNSLVTDIIMPPLGVLLGGVDLTDYAITLKKAEEGQEAVVLNYGSFLNVTLDFMIMAFAVFLVIKGMNRLRKEKPKPEPATQKCPACLMDIPVKAQLCGHCQTRQVA